MKSILMKVVCGVGLVVAGGVYAEDITVTVGQDIQLAAGGSGMITVEEGGSVDIANIGYASNYQLVIAGAGVGGKGAIYDSSSDETITNTIAGLTLSGDATIVVDHPFGVMAGEGGEAANFAFEGFTLTKGGNEVFVFDQAVNGSTNGLMDVLSGALTLNEITATTKVDFIIRTGSQLNYIRSNSDSKAATITMEEGTVFNQSSSSGYVTTNTARFVFKFKTPEMAPIIVMGPSFPMYNNGLMTIDVMDVDQRSLPVSKKFNLLERQTKSGSFLWNYGSLFTTNNVGTRYQPEITGNAVSVTIVHPQNMVHYDFEGTGADWYKNERGCAAALDSTGLLSGRGDGTTKWDNFGTMPSTTGSVQGPALGGHAALLGSGGFLATYYHNSGFLNKGNATVVSIIKPIATDKRVVWALGQNNPCMALVVENENTLVMVVRDANGVAKIVEVTNIPDLTRREHFVVTRVTPFTISLLVDDLPEATVMTDFGVKIRGNADGGIGATMWGNGLPGYLNQPKEGCWLNDFRVFQAVLNDKELAKIRGEFWKTGIIIYMK